MNTFLTLLEVSSVAVAAFVISLVVLYVVLAALFALVLSSRGVRIATVSGRRVADRAFNVLVVSDIVLSTLIAVSVVVFYVS